MSLEEFSEHPSEEEDQDIVKEPLQMLRAPKVQKNPTSPLIMKSNFQNKLGDLVNKNEKISKMASDFVVNAEQSEFSSPQTAQKLNFLGNPDILGGDGGNSHEFEDDPSDEMKHDVDNNLEKADV